MKIGLIRHFKVTLGYPGKFVTSDELLKWQQDYDRSGVEEVEIDHDGHEWSMCYSSDLDRAKNTALKAFEGDIIFAEELREVTLHPLFQSTLRLPLWLHVTLIRLAWLIGHKSQLENKKTVLERINKILDKAVEHGDNVLIVSHGGIMMYMRKELKKRGFHGPKFNRPENALLYIFEKKEDTAG
ncbi:histidine phosphatase family protein [Mesobacillus subterraneus]|uniref:Histidine phosphatase family protein n=1 Tax=Mesobacillus subterraneus TaxID=285983 RepID=A0A427TM08_9BACI|nr:histidine phosphatase family protein [Mesobacillus subterraneus]RSD25390.1 histidine phosphatase family protein [Mesobacillus subterraneus]